MRIKFRSVIYALLWILIIVSLQLSLALMEKKSLQQRSDKRMYKQYQGQESVKYKEHQKNRKIQERGQKGEDQESSNYFENDETSNSFEPSNPPVNLNQNEQPISDSLEDEDEPSNLYDYDKDGPTNLGSIEESNQNTFDALLRRKEVREDIAFINLCVDDGYLMHSLVLFHTLAKLGSRASFGIMTEGLSERSKMLLKELKIHVFEIERIKVPLHFASGSQIRDQKLFNKLRVWELSQFKKVVLLDSDIVVRANIDDLFIEFDEYTASPIIHGEEKISFYVHTPNFFNSSTKYLKADVKDKIVGQYGANSGVTVLRPSQKTFDHMMEILTQVKKRLCCPSQEFLYHYFLEFGNLTSLPFKYHYRCRKLIDLSLRDELDQTYRIYHFVEARKPWHHVIGKTKHSIAAMWWENRKELVGVIESLGFKDLELIK